MKKKKSPTPKSQHPTPPWWHPASMVVTCFGLGKLRAPGTWGSLGGILFILLFTSYLHIAVLIFPLIFFVSCVATSIYLKKRQTKDDLQEIVIDEFVSVIFTFLLAIFTVFALDDQAETQNYSLTAMGAVSFAIFRLFDILKPWPIRYFDRKVKGAFGVMFDDLLAGLFAGVVSALVFLVIVHI